MADLYVAACNEQIWLAVYDTTVLMVARTALTPAAVRIERQLCRELRQRQRPIHLLHVLSGAVPEPSDEVCDEERRFNEELGPHVMASAVALLGEALWRSNMRAVLQRIEVTLPHAVQRTVRGSVEQATRWLEQRGGAPAVELRAALAPCLTAASSSCCGRLRRGSDPT